MPQGRCAFTTPPKREGTQPEDFSLNDPHMRNHNSFKAIVLHLSQYLKVGYLDEDTLGGSSGVGDIHMTILGIHAVMNVGAEWSPEASQVHL